MFTESTPYGDSIIAISSSDPEVEKYWLNSYTTKQINPENSLLRSNFYKPEVQSFSNLGAGVKSFSAAPEKTIAGSSRSFEESSHINPFFVPFLLPPNFDVFQLNNWFRNIENVYEQPDPKYIGDGEVRTVTAVNDNGHVYGKIETVHLDKKRP